MVRRLALRILSGAHQGAVVPVAPGTPLVLGRREGADVIVQDDHVSRRHARIAFEGEDLMVEDLGSTNGTYLNGNRVRRGRAAEGDRIMVGGCLLKVIAVDAAPAMPFEASPPPPPFAAAPPSPPLPPQSPPPPPSPQAFERAVAARPAPAPPSPRERAMQGRVEDVPLSDLFQLLATSRKSGVLVVIREGHVAEVTLDAGRVLGCCIDSRNNVGMKKSLHRLLGWTSGTFELRSVSLSPGAGVTGEALGPLVADALQQLDDLRRLLPRLPDRVAVSGSPADLEAADPADRSLLSLASQLGSVPEILDATPLSDLQAAQRIAALLTRGLLVGMAEGS